MDVVAAKLLKEIDPAELGDRLRAVRVAHGMTQTDLAGELVSVGYVSRLESGQRRPNAAVLDGLAQRLGVPVDHLLRGDSAREQDELRLAIDFAELSLENGDAVEAETQARTAIDRASSLSLHDLADRGRFLVARALEVQGAIDEAIIELEPLLSHRDLGLLQIKAAIALSRCLRESGDLSQAIDVAERTLEHLATTPLDGTDESVQLAVTLAAAYYERGDTGQAVRTCRKAVDKAEKLASPAARASAYWNASILEAKKGQIHDAVPLAERALALLAEGAGGRNLARLRSVFADMQLQLDPPGLEEAERQFDLAAQELRASSASAIDLARNDLGRARMLLLGGDFSAAGMQSAAVHDAVREQAPIIAAEAKAVEGQAVAACGMADQAARAYRSAVLLLTGAGADREAAQLWFELGGLLEGVGDFESARDAYRSAAASTGLRSRSAVQVPIR